MQDTFFESDISDDEFIWVFIYMSIHCNPDALKQDVLWDDEVISGLRFHHHRPSVMIQSLINQTEAEILVH